MKELLSSKKLFTYAVGALAAVLHVVAQTYFGIDLPWQPIVGLLSLGGVYILAEAGLDHKDMDRRQKEKEAEAKARAWEDEAKMLLDYLAGSDEKKEKEEKKEKKEDGDSE